MDDRDEQIGRRIVDYALRIHTALGPGLLERAYEICLAHELVAAGIGVRRQVEVPVSYGGIDLGAGFRIDLLVDGCVVVELKSVERLLPVHLSQMLTYLRFSSVRLGFLLNFNVRHMKDGIRRVVLH